MSEIIPIPLDAGLMSVRILSNLQKTACLRPPNDLTEKVIESRDPLRLADASTHEPGEPNVRRE